MLDDIIAMIEAQKQALQDFLGGIGNVFQEMLDVLGIVGDIVAEISGFFSMISDLIYSEIFTGIVFDSFIDFFTGTYICYNFKCFIIICYLSCR